jgi:DNA invertase Pin-like site-specific DNA recombinase
VTPAIPYIRVSRDSQGRSGLGLEAQMAAITRFADTEGFELSNPFVEVETGKGSDALERRPQLAAALKQAKKSKAPVVVAKLDRLSRDVHFISGLMVHKVPFIVAELGRGHRSLPAAHLRRVGREGACVDFAANPGSFEGRQSARRETWWRK